MTCVIPMTLFVMILTVTEAVAAPAAGSFENELDIVNESYFTDRLYSREEPRPQTITRGQAAWTPFNIQQGFHSTHLMNEQACRNFLKNLRMNTGTACMNVHNGYVFYQVDFIGPLMP
ncbi:hypothetical protein E4L95_12535 [Paracoccus liaowanqingii]|uniref:Uncharacterized protein n=1 Tax=Paracoccus liaowanqingii TaxID=2560053 RepID=A0A4Z1C8H4_9RHOB|nr:hypothetical protein [Paracoccus liaowanqingii]QDA35698.1 hypothetical protein E4191_16125 [Paracoccus liaowanqingii]TGN58377.1 hypothetical protein E4L95_12535 [Paracoccus liaowanqingii]